MGSNYGIPFVKEGNIDRKGAENALNSVLTVVLPDKPKLEIAESLRNLNNEQLLYILGGMNNNKKASPVVAKRILDAYKAILRGHTLSGVRSKNARLRHIQKDILF